MSKEPKSGWYSNVLRTSHSYLGKLLLGLVAMCFSTGMTFAQVATPELIPTGNISRPVSYTVFVTCATVGAEMRYTLDGTDPDLTSAVVPVDRKVKILKTATLKVKAWVGSQSSNVVTGLFEVVGDIAAGGYHALAVKTNKTAFGWGLSQYGVLSNGLNSATDPVLSPVPTEIVDNSPISNASSSAAGLNHSLTLYTSNTVEGGVYAYGRNEQAQLGNNSLTTPATFYPVTVFQSASNTPLTGAIQVAAADTYSAALMADGRVMTWGLNTSSRLGRLVENNNDRYAGYVTSSIATEAHLTDIDQIAAGKVHMLARKAGQVYVWGLNSSGQLGTLDTKSQTRAFLNVNLANITDLSAGALHSAVVKWDATNQGRVYCFGQRQYGRLGNNVSSSANVSTPQLVVTDDAAMTPLTNIIEVVCGPRHTLALDSSNRVWAWGYNIDGELGDNSTTSKAKATLVKNPSGTGPLLNICRIAAGGVEGDGFSLAIAKDGKCYAWGANTLGQLGLGHTNFTKLPTEVPSMQLTNIGAPNLTSTVLDLQISAEPGRCVFNSTVTDPDGQIDISHVVYTLNGNGHTVTYNNASSNAELVLPGLLAGNYNYSARAFDKSGAVSNVQTGSFIVQPTVTVTALTSAVIEGASKSAFRISRVSANSTALLVNFNVTGDAVGGVDYLALPTSVEIPSGASFVDLVITALADDPIEPAETCVLSIVTSANYNLNSLATSTVEIHDGSDADQDGISNKDELALGTNPNVNQTAQGSNPGYQYDAVGRLKSFSSFSWSYDAEGNLLNAQ